MIKTIYKYELKSPLPYSSCTENIDLPQGARFLKAAVQAGKIVLWFEVEKEDKLKPFNFAIQGTGSEFEIKADKQRLYLDTVFDGPYVWHIYRLGV